MKTGSKKCHERLKGSNVSLDLIFQRKKRIHANLNVKTNLAEFSRFTGIGEMSEAEMSWGQMLRTTILSWGNSTTTRIRARVFFWHDSGKLSATESSRGWVENVNVVRRDTIACGFCMCFFQAAVPLGRRSHGASIHLCYCVPQMEATMTREYRILQIRIEKTSFFPLEAGCEYQGIEVD